MLSRGSQVPGPEPTPGFLVWAPPKADPEAGFVGRQFLGRLAQKGGWDVVRKGSE